MFFIHGSIPEYVGIVEKVKIAPGRHGVHPFWTLECPEKINIVNEKISNVPVKLFKTICKTFKKHNNKTCLLCTNCCQT